MSALTGAEHETPSVRRDFLRLGTVVRAAEVRFTHG